MLRLTEDAGFKRRVMGETGTYTPTTIGKPPHPKQTPACLGFWEHMPASTCLQLARCKAMLLVCLSRSFAHRV